MGVRRLHTEQKKNLMSRESNLKVSTSRYRVCSRCRKVEKYNLKSAICNGKDKIVNLIPCPYRHMENHANLLVP